MSHYVIRGGQQGKRRLEVLARVMWPGTFRLLKTAGIREGMICLDLGCGGGDVTIEMSRLIGPNGRIAGTDMDAIKLALASEEAARQGLGNVEFRNCIILEWYEDSAYDLIYAR